jgi:antitoxin component of MazEF toxin-antitoxin module
LQLSPLKLLLKPFQSNALDLHHKYTCLNILTELDKLKYCIYNVRMTIKTSLTTSGNSVAVRLPKSVLQMSGLTDKVLLEVKNGKIILSKPANPREGWDTQIKAMVEKYGDPSEEFADIDGLVNDGLDSLPWNGPTYGEWLKSNGRLS